MRSALEAVEGVSKAQVSMPNSAVITCSKDVKDSTLKRAVRKAGYKAKVVTK